VLIYRVPSEPTRLRSTVWRRLKGVGAIYLQNSAAALPADKTSERALRALRNEIGQMGGSAHLLRSSAVVGAADLTAEFNAARNEEYREIVDRCDDFLEEIKRETAEEHFTYAELEENDEDLVKLRSWLEKVAARDVLGASGREEASEALGRCEEALSGFAECVYAAEEHT
jgi:uncharacterized protein YdbL (DUF1318 family)